MTLQEQINQDIRSAILKKESNKLSVLRSIKAALLSESAKDGNPEISDKVAINLIRKIAKQRKDAAEIYNQQGREDLEKQELIELDYLQIYLPKQMDNDDIRKIIKQIIQELEASPKEIGKVIGAAMQKLSGKADGNIVAQITREELSK